MAGNVVRKMVSARWKAAQARALGATQEEAARQAGVSARTVQRWEATSDGEYWREFDATWKDLKQAAWVRALRVLQEELSSPNPMIRIRAASKILESTFGGGRGGL